MNVAHALARAASLGIERLDAQLLLLHALGRSGNDRGWLLAHDTDEFDATAHAAYLALCERRAAGEPLAYIVGVKEFHGIELAVDARVLVPRPDTETLVDEVLARLAAGGCLRDVQAGLPHPPQAGLPAPQAGLPDPLQAGLPDPPRALRVADVGTGSGAV